MGIHEGVLRLEFVCVVILNVVALIREKRYDGCILKMRSDPP